MPENIYTVSPDAVSHAIKVLWIVLGAVGSAITIIGGGGIKAILFVGKKIDDRFNNIETNVAKIAHNFDNMDKNTSMEIAGVKLRCAFIHADDPRAQIRSSDFTSCADREKKGK